METLSCVHVVCKKLWKGSASLANHARNDAPLLETYGIKKKTVSLQTA